MQSMALIDFMEDEDQRGQTEKTCEPVGKEAVIIKRLSLIYHCVLKKIISTVVW